MVFGKVIFLHVQHFPVSEIFLSDGITEQVAPMLIQSNVALNRRKLILKVMMVSRNIKYAKLFIMLVTMSTKAVFSVKFREKR